MLCLDMNIEHLTICLQKLLCYHLLPTSFIFKKLDQTDLG